MALTALVYCHPSQGEHENEHRKKRRMPKRAGVERHGYGAQGRVGERRTGVGGCGEMVAAGFSAMSAFGGG